MDKSREVLATEITGLKEDFDRYSASIEKQLNQLAIRFDQFASSYLRTDIYEIRHKELNDKIDYVEKDLGGRVRSNKVEIARLKSQKWVWSLVSFVLGSVLVSLMLYAFTHRT